MSDIVKTAAFCFGIGATVIVAHVVVWLALYWVTAYLGEPMIRYLTCGAG